MSTQSGGSIRPLVEEVRLPEALGTRLASRIADQARKLEAHCWIENETNERAYATDVYALLMLGAHAGSCIRIGAEGPEARAGLAALRAILDPSAKETR